MNAPTCSEHQQLQRKACCLEVPTTEQSYVRTSHTAFARGENSATETIACTSATYARHGTFPTLLGKSGSVPDNQSPVIHLLSLKGKEKMTLPATSPLGPTATVTPSIQQKVKKERKHVWQIGDMTPLDEWVNRYDVLSH